MIIIVARTGRRMQMAARVRMAGYSGDADRGAVGEAARVTMTTIARLDAFEHFDLVADALAGADAALERLAVLDEQHLLDAGKDDERRLRDDQALGLVGDDLRLGERAWAQAAGLVGNLGFDRQRAVAFGDRRAEPRDAAAVDGGIAFDGDVDGLPEAKAGGRALGHRELQPQRMLAHDGEDGRARGAILAGKRHGARGRRRRSASAATCRRAAGGPARAPIAAARARPGGCGLPRAHPGSDLRRSGTARRRSRDRRAAEMPRCTKVAMRSRCRRASSSAARA